MLTGKAKEKFANWFESNYKYNERKFFYNNPSPSMQWGVIQDFADSLELHTTIERDDSNNDFDVIVKGWYLDNSFPSRQEARAAAIEKLNELINKT